MFTQFKKICMCMRLDDAYCYHNVSVMLNLLQIIGKAYG